MKHKVFALATITILLGGLLVNLFPGHTLANQSVPPGNPLSATNDQIQNMQCNWVNVEEFDCTINGTSEQFVNISGMDNYWDSATGSDPPNQTYQYDSGTTCDNKSIIWANPYYYNQSQPYVKADIWASQPGVTGVSCRGVEVNGPTGTSGDSSSIPKFTNPIGATQNADIFYEFSGDNIVRIDGNGGYTFVPSGIANVFVKTTQSSNSCPDTIVYNSGAGNSMGNGTLWTLQTGPGSYPDPPSSVHADSSCGVSNDTSDLNDTNCGPLANACTVPINTNKNDGSETLHIGGSPPSNPGVAGAGGGTCTGANQNSSNCEGQVVVCSATFTNPISWFVCPIISTIQDFMNSVGSEITSYLTVPNKFFDQSTASGAAMHQAWASLRDIALAILVIAALIMVFSQAISVGPLDPYTVKKLLPRILAAAILVTLSWPLVSLAVGISNGLGEGVRSIILAPFHNLGNVNFTGGDEGLALVAGLGLGAVLGLIGIFTLGLSAAIALFVGLAVIVIRQIVLILLAILSPIALVLFILPGTDQGWKLWWDSFFGVLIMFPLIEAFIAAGSVFSKIAISGGSTGTLDKIIAFMAIYLPFFLLPSTVRMAGGAMRTIGGAVDTAHRGVQGGLTNARKGIRQQRVARAQAGGFQDRGLGRLYNRVGRGAAVGLRGRGGFGRQGRAALATATMAGNEEALRNNRMLHELRNNDDANAVMALSGGTGAGAREAARDLFTDEHGVYNQARAESALAAAGAVGYSRQNSAAAFQTASQNKWRAVGAGRVDILQNGINRLAGRNTQEADNMAYNSQYFNRETGRGDLGGAWHQPDIQGRATALAGAAGISQAEAMRHVTALDGIGRTEVPAMVRGHPAQLQQYANSIRTMMQHGSVEERNTAAQHLLEMQKALPYASDDGKRIINNLLEGDAANPGFVDYDATAQVLRRDRDNAPILDAATGAPIFDDVQISIEDQLAGAAGTGISGTALSRAARTYDRETGMGPNGPGAIGGGPPAPAPGP
jgi:hypothetical protein